MALKKGDIIDEYKRFPDSCGLVVKVMAGGEGFHRILCCGHELTDEDVVPERLKKGGRKPGPKGLGFIIDEKRLYENSCGLRLIVLEGGNSLEHIECCGHTLTLADEKELGDIGLGSLRKAGSGPEPPSGPIGTA